MKKPKSVAPIVAPAPVISHREAIYFMKGDASLSPGALIKLKTWSETWGTKGVWTLACPPGPDISYCLLESRIMTLRTELGKLGATKVDTRLAPKELPNRYDPVYIELDPFKDRVYTESFRPPWIIRPIQKVSTAIVKKRVVRVKAKKGRVREKESAPDTSRLVAMCR